MMYFFQEKKPLGDVCGLHVLVRSGLAFIGELEAKNGDTIVGLVAACVSVFSYAGILLAYE